MDKKEYFLITGGPEVPVEVEGALSAALKVVRCPGPAGVYYCPAAHHEICPLRTGAKAAVVYLSGRHEFFGKGNWECAAGGTSPAIVVIAGSGEPRRGRRPFVTVGGESGALGVLKAVAEVFDEVDRPEEFEQRNDDQHPES